MFSDLGSIVLLIFKEIFNTDLFVYVIGLVLCVSLFTFTISFVRGDF